MGESELPRANEGTTVFSLTRLQIIYTDGYKYYTLVGTNNIHRRVQILCTSRSKQYTLKGTNTIH